MRSGESVASFSGRRENESTRTMWSRPLALSARISREPTKPAPPVTRHQRPFMLAWPMWLGGIEEAPDLVGDPLERFRRHLGVNGQRQNSRLIPVRHGEVLRLVAEV